MAAHAATVLVRRVLVAERVSFTHRLEKPYSTDFFRGLKNPTPNLTHSHASVDEEKTGTRCLMPSVV